MSPFWKVSTGRYTRAFTCMRMQQHMLKPSHEFLHIRASPALASLQHLQICLHERGWSHQYSCKWERNAGILNASATVLHCHNGRTLQTSHCQPSILVQCILVQCSLQCSWSANIHGYTRCSIGALVCHAPPSYRDKIACRQICKCIFRILWFMTWDGLVRFSGLKPGTLCCCVWLAPSSC